MASIARRYHRSLSDYDAFAPIYDDWSAHMTEDVAFYVELAREADGPVVELAVGNGRVAVPVAQALGRPMLGIDRSPAMLEGARARGGAGVEHRAAAGGHARARARGAGRARSTAPARSLLHLPTWADRRRVFERVYASLRPGGRFAWNAFVFDPHIAARNDGEWEEQNGIRHRVDHVPQDNRIDITLESGDTISLWWLNRSEWEALIDVPGFEVEALYGGFAQRAVRRVRERVRLGCPQARMTRSPGSTTRGRRASQRTSSSTSRRRGRRAGLSWSSPSAPGGSPCRSQRPASA